MPKEQTALIKIPFIIGLLSLFISLLLVSTNLISLGLKLKQPEAKGAFLKKEPISAPDIKKEKDLSAVVIEAPTQLAVAPNKLRFVVLKFQNTGKDTWERDGARPVQLGLLPDNRHFSYFHADNWISVDRPAKLVERRVRPGQIGTFYFYFKGAVKLPPGLYTEQMGLVKETVGWFDKNEGGVSWQIPLKPTRLVSVSTIFPQFFSEFAYQFDPKPIFAFNLIIVSAIFFAFSWANLYLHRIFPKQRPSLKVGFNFGPTGTHVYQGVKSNFGPTGRRLIKSLPQYVFHWRFYATLGGLSLLILGILFLFLTALIYQENHETATIEYTAKFAFLFLIGATLLIALAWAGIPSGEKNEHKKSV